MNSCDVVAVAQNRSFGDQPPKAIVQSHFVVEIVEEALLDVSLIQIRSINFSDENDSTIGIRLANRGDQPIPKIRRDHFRLEDESSDRSFVRAASLSIYHVTTESIDALIDPVA